MSENEDSGAEEKSFDASETKIRKSRDKGDTPQSTEANTLMLYMGLAVAIVIFGKSVASNALISLSSMLEYPGDMGKALLDSKTAKFGQNGASEFLWKPVMALGPIFMLLILGIIVSLVLQRAIVVAPSKLMPKLSRLSPVSNAKQKYGMTGMVEFGKRCFKLAFISSVAMYFFFTLLKQLPGMSAIPYALIVPEMNKAALQLILFMIIAMGLITLVDLPYAWFAHMKKLRMTLKEIKDESKESEGDPHLKGERRRRAMALSQATMMNDVAKADVIIVNPTHYAVALKWDREQKMVPVLLAKGVDELAFRIRKKAKENNIPIHSDPPCARSIYAGVEVGGVIKPEHYAAVAASIHFADSLKRKGYES